MAKIYMVVDDITGEQFQPGTDEGQEGVVLSFMGERVQLDLAKGTIGKLREQLAPYFDKGTAPAPEVVKPVRKTSTGKPSLAANREHTQAVRDWSRANGYEVSERGRIPAKLVDAFNEAHASGVVARAIKASNKQEYIPAPTPPTARELAEQADELLRNAAKPAKPDLPTAEELARVHEESKAKVDPMKAALQRAYDDEAAAKRKAQAAADALFSRPDEDDDDTGGNTVDEPKPQIIEINIGGLNAWLQQQGIDPAGLKYTTKLKMYRTAHPGTEVKFIKAAS